MRQGERRTVAYIRVSTEEQAREGYSLEDQERAARLYAQARMALGEGEWGEVAEVYADPGVSGTLRSRPGLDRLLADARAGTVGRVICTKLDRIGRTAAIILAIEDELDGYGVARTFIRDSIDTSTASGRLLRTVLAAVAELERDLLLERTREGKAAKARRGDVWRSRPVYGYRYVPGDKKAGTPGRLEIDEATAPVVRRIFRELAAGITVTALCVALNSAGVPTLRGGLWSHSTIGYIIRNPLYWGRATYARTVAVKEGTVLRRRPNPDPAAVHYIAAPALVDAATAEAARAAVARNRWFSRRNAHRDYLLRGLLRCGDCGRPMHAAAGTYTCHNALPNGKPARHRVGQARLERAVKERIADFVRTPDPDLADLSALAAAARARAEDAEAARINAEREAATMAQQQEQLLSLHLAGGLSRERFVRKDALLDEQRRGALDRAAALAARRDAALAQSVPADDVRALCRHLATRLDSLSPQAWQQALRLLLDEVVATRERAELRGALRGLEGAVPLDADAFAGEPSRPFAGKQPALPFTLVVDLPQDPGAHGKEQPRGWHGHYAPWGSL